MKWLKIFSISVLIIWIGFKGYKLLEDYLITSDIEYYHATLLKTEENILYIDNIFIGENNQMPYEGHGMLKSGRVLTDKEYRCMNDEGFFYAKYENDYFSIVCKMNTSEVLYIE